MRDAENVTVERAIVHKIDHLGGTSVLSEIELDLSAQAALQDYFRNQIVNALADEHTHAAKFASSGSMEARDESLLILRDDAAFVPSSQKLADLLRAAMQGDNRIAAGSLAVCRYTASNYPELKFLALIKLDPGQALVQKIERVGGKRRVSFDVQTNVMPTERERLQKAALIPSSSVNEKYDLLLLDQQAVRAAAFFAGKFLNTTIAFDARTTTGLLWAAIQNGRKAAHLTPEEWAALQDFIPVAMGTERQTVSGLVRRLPIADEKKKVFREQIKTLLPGEDRLELDPEYAQSRLLRSTKFRGDHGVRFEVFTRDYDKVVKSVKPLEGEENLTEVVLHIRNMQWS